MSVGRDLKNNSPEAIAERRGYWAARRVSGGSARRVPSGQGAAARSAVSSATSHVARYARNPVAYTKSNGVGGAVLTFFALVALSSLRRGAWPHQHDLLTIASGTIVVVVAASIAPDLVTYVLLTVLVIMVLTNASIILKLLGWATGRAVGAVSA